jgi:6-phosphogluconate dehydrogenase
MCGVLLAAVPLQAPAAVAGVDKAQLVADVRAALYCSKICSYAQGMNIIKAKSEEKAWGVDLGGLARIWKVRSCILCCFCVQNVFKS